MLAAQIAAPVALRNLRELEITFTSSSYQSMSEYEDICIDEVRDLAQRWLPSLPSLGSFTIEVNYPDRGPRKSISWNEGIEKVVN